MYHDASTRTCGSRGSKARYRAVKFGDVRSRLRGEGVNACRPARDGRREVCPPRQVREIVPRLAQGAHDCQATMERVRDAMKLRII